VTKKTEYPSIDFGKKELTITGLRYSRRILLSLLSAKNKKETRFNIEGLFLDASGTYNGSWSFPSNLVVSDNYRNLELENGYFVIVDKTSNSTWSVRTAKAESVVLYRKFCIVIIIINISIY